MVDIMYLTKLQVQRQFLVPNIVETIVIIFYKITCNLGLAFNLAIIKFFDLIYAGMLAFLFAVIYYNISEYQNKNKVLRSFDEKIAQSDYCYI